MEWTWIASTVGGGVLTTGLAFLRNMTVRLNELEKLMITEPEVRQMIIDKAAVLEAVNEGFSKDLESLEYHIQRVDEKIDQMLKILIQKNDD